MSVSLLVHCDHPDCKESQEFRWGWGETPVEVRHVFHLTGWTMGAWNRTYCKLHSEPQQ